MAPWRRFYRHIICLLRSFQSRKTEKFLGWYKGISPSLVLSKQFWQQYQCFKSLNCYLWNKNSHILLTSIWAFQRIWWGYCINPLLDSLTNREDLQLLSPLKSSNILRQSNLQIRTCNPQGLDISLYRYKNKWNVLFFGSKINRIDRYFLAICPSLELQPSVSDPAYNIYYTEFYHWIVQFSDLLLWEILHQHITWMAILFKTAELIIYNIYSHLCIVHKITNAMRLFLVL